MFPLFNGPLPHRRAYLRKQVRYGLWALAFVLLSLSIGIAGYMALAGMPLTDAFLNASMILGGMGPVDPMPNTASKWFAGTYAIFCGVALLTIVATMLAPTVHHLLHMLHMDWQEEVQRTALPGKRKG